MFRRRWPTLLKILFAGFVVGAIATQIEPTKSPHIKAVLADKPEGPVATVETTRQAPPVSAVLTKAIASTENRSSSGDRSPTPAMPAPNTPETVSSVSDSETRPSGQEQAEVPVWVRVNGSVVNVRSAPAASAQRIGSFTEGTRLRVVESGGKWTKVEDPKTGRSGWMFGSYLARISGDGEPAS